MLTVFVYKFVCQCIPLSGGPTSRTVLAAGKGVPRNIHPTALHLPCLRSGLIAYLVRVGCSPIHYTRPWPSLCTFPCSCPPFVIFAPPPLSLPLPPCLCPLLRPAVPLSHCLSIPPPMRPSQSRSNLRGIRARTLPHHRAALRNQKLRCQHRVRVAGHADFAPGSLIRSDEFSSRLKALSLRRDL